MLVPLLLAMEGVLEANQQVLAAVGAGLGVVVSCERRK
jgi:hypothetical protein